MQKNDLIRMTCDNIGADMEGVCRHDGMAVFVPRMLPGETADVRITKVQPRYAFGRMEGAPEPPSADRKAPDCPAWPRCGGCTCRHMTYEATLRWKHAQVLNCYRRIAHLDVQVEPVLGMAEPFAYRNKTALPIGGTADQPVAGFFAPRSHVIIPADACPNAMVPSADITAAVLRWMRANRIPPYREESHSGLIRHLVIRVNRRREALAALVVNGDGIPAAEELEAVLRPLGVISLVLNVNRDRTNVIFGREFRTVYGPGLLEDELCGLRFEVSPAAFFQVNPAQTEVLYRTALDCAGLTGSELVCDVYCGAGTITLMMARHARRAVGIEIVPQAIGNAKKNALANNVTNADFLCAPAEEALPRLVADGLRPDVIVVDPPRKGLDPAVIEAMLRAAPERIVYVSCNVATQARDAALLAAGGYRVDRVQPVDMFCWTSGVETVCLLSKEPAAVRSGLL